MSSGKPKSQRTRSTTFTIRSIFVITTVFAAGAVSMGYLFRAANGKSEEIGPFVIITMVMPLALMITMSWTFRIVKWFEKEERRAALAAFSTWLLKRTLKRFFREL